MIGRLAASVFLLLVLSTTIPALADGGRMQMHATAGPFVVSLFSSPDTLRVGPADLSVLVQKRANNAIVLDGSAILTLAPEGGVTGAFTVPLTQAAATNHLLRAAEVRFLKPGRWNVTVTVRRGAEQAECSTVLDVAPANSRRVTLWFFVLLPLVVILLFFFVQVQKRKLRHGSQTGA